MIRIIIILFLLSRLILLFFIIKSQLMFTNIYDVINYIEIAKSGDSDESGASGTNLDVMRRLSQLEKMVYGSKSDKDEEENK